MRPGLRRSLAGVLVGVLTLFAAAAAAGDSDGLERLRIARERAAALAQFDERERACQDRFAVTDCVNAARQVQRDTLASLRRQDALLDEAARRQRAAQRMAAIRAKVSAEENRTRDVTKAERRPSAIRVVPPRELPPPRAGRVAAPASAAASAPGSRPAEASVTPAQRDAREQRQRAAFETRTQAAQAHREAARRRSDERQLKGKSAQPLPQEPAASSP